MTFMKIYDMFKDVVLVKRLSMLPRDAYVVEANGKSFFTSNTLGEYKSIVLSFIGISDKSKEGRHEHVSKAMAKWQSSLADLYMSHIATFYSSKKGLFRKHLFGFRTHFSYRATITAQRAPNRHDQIGVPWPIICVTYEFILMNILNKRLGYRKGHAVTLIRTHVKRYHPDIKRAIEIMWEERDFELGWPTLGQRSPSLHQGSIPLFWEYPKYDPLDETVSYPDKTTPISNADFDGDQLHFYPLFDRKSVMLFISLDIAFSTMGIDKLDNIGGMYKMTDPVSAILSNASSRTEDVPGVPLDIPEVV
jgi:hypothetical protein